MRGYQTLAEALAEANRHGAVGIMVDTKAIRIGLDRIAALEAALNTMLGAFDPDWPGACAQECFDTSDGHGYERQQAARRNARTTLLQQ